MKAQKWVQFQDSTLSIGDFQSPEKALEFLRQQSSNLDWIAQWTIVPLNRGHGDFVFYLQTSRRVVVHF